MNIFITGGSGFIGSHLKEYLSKNQNIFIFTPKNSELDLTKEVAVDEYINRNKIDIVIHLANRGGGRDTLDMKNITEYNLRIFFNIAKQKNKVDKIISFGSGAEYGKHKPIINASESEYKKSLPFDEYGFYKAITSHYIEDCTANIIQLRLFGIYGEYENYRYKFITNSIAKNLLQLPIIINQNVFFDYMYIDDLLNIIEYFIFNNARYKIYNASSGEKIDLITLANIINEIGDFKSEIIIKNLGLNNEYTASNQLLKNEMKDRFSVVSHKEAITKIYKYFKQNLINMDTESIKNDPYIKNIDKIWKGEK